MLIEDFAYKENELLMQLDVEYRALYRELKAEIIKQAFDEGYKAAKEELQNEEKE